MPHNHCQLPFAANGLTNGAEKVRVAGEGCTAQRANLARPQRQPEAVAAATGGRQELSRRVAKARLIFTDVCEEPPGGGGLGCAMRHSSPAEGFFLCGFWVGLGGQRGVQFSSKAGGFGPGDTLSSVVWVWGNCYSLPYPTTTPSWRTPLRRFDQSENAFLD